MIYRASTPGGSEIKLTAEGRYGKCLTAGVGEENE